MIRCNGGGSFDRMVFVAMFLGFGFDELGAQ